MTRCIPVLLACLLCGCASTRGTKNAGDTPLGGAPIRLGNFSVSLAVKDLGASREFYEKLGFRVIGGDAAQNWLILQNETSTIGSRRVPATIVKLESLT